MEELIEDTKKFNEIYKRLFKEYFDKPLKKDGFYKKGTINFYRLNELGILESLNFQRYYNKLTVNYSTNPLCCGATKNILIGGRLGYYFNNKDYWWSLKDEETMEKSMSEILKIIQTKQYSWFKNMEIENELISFISKSFYIKIDYFLTLATLMAKFKRYDKIQFYIDKVKNEFVVLKEEGFERDWIPPIMEETLLLEEKLKEGYQEIDKYIIEREKQSLRELGLEKLIK